MKVQIVHRDGRIYTHTGVDEIKSNKDHFGRITDICLVGFHWFSRVIFNEQGARNPVVEMRILP